MNQQGVGEPHLQTIKGQRPGDAAGCDRGRGQDEHHQRDQVHGENFGQAASAIVEGVADAADLAVGPVDEKTRQDEKERHPGRTQLHGNHSVDLAKQL